ncbi:hypothetical protein BS47DRAFT_1364384 [Hydnum rufescens UP504]|uniref:Uncharacterized protein n=1 Tax=Hydnum rufescens UP504 TaxID=1448309 RepID=A0A9P6ARR5_9AGAM|nr:hypothetical protein BS47DRAFT_1364384 [Hydnum rufescens UP504]
MEVAQFLFAHGALVQSNRLSFIPPPVLDRYLVFIIYPYELDLTQHQAQSKHNSATHPPQQVPSHSVKPRPKNAPTGPWAKYGGGRSHSRPQRSYIRNIQRNKYSATHPPKWVHSLHDIRPNRCTGRVQDKTRDHAATHTPQPLIFRNVYEDETNTMPHTCFGGLSPSAKPDPNNAQTMPTVKYGSVQPPKTRTPSTICKIHDDASNTVPHTRFGGYLHCAIPDPTNAQIRPRAKHGSVQPPRPLTLEYPHLLQQQNKYGATHPLQRLLSLSTKPHLMNGQRRPAVKYGARSQSDPNPRALRTIIRRQIRYATHPLRRVHSLHENPPDKPTKTRMSPQCDIQCAATQATSARPPK